MAKVTSKLQVSIPKRMAEKHRLKPGDDIFWRDSAEAILLVPAATAQGALSVSERLALFDSATSRQQKRQRRAPKASRAKNRGWKREDLYDRARTR